MRWIMQRLRVGGIPVLPVLLAAGVVVAVVLVVGADGRASPRVPAVELSETAPAEAPEPAPESTAAGPTVQRPPGAATMGDGAQEVSPSPVPVPPPTPPRATDDDDGDDDEGPDDEDDDDERGGDD